jgi:hypothetical protein
LVSGNRVVIGWYLSIRGSVRNTTHLVVGEHSKRVNLCVGGEPRALAVLARHHTRDEGSVPQAVVERALVRPVSSFFNLAEMRVVRLDSSVENTCCQNTTSI